jgi:hypothetical protein
MIPTFANLIKNANIRADESELVSLNTQLAISEVNNASDLYALIRETYGENKVENFAPRSSQYGLSYWYDVEKNVVFLSSVSNLEGASEPTVQPITHVMSASKGVLPSATPLAASETKRNQAFYDEHKDNSIRMHHDRYYCLDLGGLVGDVLVAMESGDKAAIEEAKAALLEATDGFTEAAKYFIENYAKKGTVEGGILYTHAETGNFESITVNGVEVGKFELVRTHYNFSYLTELEVQKLVESVLSKTGFKMDVLHDTKTADRPAQYEVIIGDTTREGVEKITC